MPKDMSLPLYQYVCLSVLLTQLCMQGATHLSSFSTAFSLMQAAMMMPDEGTRFMLDRSIDSTGVVPLSSSIGSAWPSKLRIQEAQGVIDPDLGCYAKQLQSRRVCTKTCNVHGLSGSPEAGQLRVRQRLSQFEDTTHVGHPFMFGEDIVVTERVVAEAASANQAQIERMRHYWQSIKSCVRRLEVADLLEAAQSRVALEAFCNRRAARSIQVVPAKTECRQKACHWLLTVVKTKLECYIGSPEAPQLRVRQRLGQLEDAQHDAAVFASQRVFVEAASECGEQLSAPKAVDMRGGTARSRRATGIG